MVVTNDGKNRIRDLLAADIINARVGSGVTSATATDTDLVVEIVGSDKTPVVTTSNKTLSISTTWLSTEVNGNTISESSVDTSTVLLDRFVFPNYEKTATNELTVIDIINIL